MNINIYPDSESNNPNMSTELDFDQWLDLSVEREILRGYKLREEKQKKYSYRDKCGVPNRECYYSPCVEYCSSKCPAPKTFRKDACKRPSIIHWRNCHPASYGAQAYVSAPVTSNVKTRCRVKCPLRIAELAVPTKRQCIDTWRNKCDVLPDCMVERLRQQIMDEKPIAQIADAINCFKRRKAKSMKSTSRSKIMRHHTKLKNDKLDELRKLCALFAHQINKKLITPKNLKLNPELSKISQIVADEIADIMKNKKRLNAFDNKMYGEISAKITMWIATVLEDTAYKLLEDDLRELEEEEGPVLDFLDEVIDNAVNMCMSDAKDFGEYSKSTSLPIPPKSGKQYDRNNASDSLERDDFDASTVVTTTTYNIRDNITANKINDKVKRSHEMDSMIPKTHLDFGNTDLNTNEIRNEIDKIINSITINDKIERNIVNNKRTHDSSAKISKMENIDYSDVKDGKTNDKYIADTSELQDALEKFKQEIDRGFPVSTTIEDVSLILPSYLDTPKDINQPNNLSSPKPISKKNFHYSDIKVDLTNDEDIHRVNILDLQDVPDISKEENEQVVPNLIPIEDGTLFSKSLPNTGTDDIQSNDLSSSKPSLNKVSDVFEIFATESSDEKKTVTFSNTDLDGHQAIRKLKENNTMQLKNEKYSTRQHLTFAPRNENLLSEMDETWPADLPSPVMKITASVSRSITSLGKILETEERISISFEENMNSKSDDIFNIELEIVNENEINKIDKDIKSHNDLYYIKTESDQNFHIHDSIHIELENNNNNERNEGNINEKDKTKTNITRGNKNSLKSSNLIYSSKDNFKFPHLDWKNKIIETIKPKESVSNVSYKAIQEKIKSTYYIKPEPSIHYKVNLSTAPLWVKQDHSKSELNQNSYMYKNTKIGHFDTRDVLSWSKDLDRMFANIELWNRWLEIICKETMRLQHRREINKLFYPKSKRIDSRHWSRLKKNIDKDAFFWARLTERIKCYKKKTMLKAPLRGLGTTNPNSHCQI